jgi:hypothetical protein
MKHAYVPKEINPCQALAIKLSIVVKLLQVERSSGFRDDAMPGEVKDSYE